MYNSLSSRTLQLMKEIVEHQKTEQKANALIQRNRVMMQSTPEGVHIMDDQSNIIMDCPQFIHTCPTPLPCRSHSGSAPNRLKTGSMKPARCTVQEPRKPQPDHEQHSPRQPKSGSSVNPWS
jgi:hypothetical protein